MEIGWASFIRDCWQVCDKEHTAAAAAVTAGSGRSGSGQQCAAAAGSSSSSRYGLRQTGSAWKLAAHPLREMADSRVESNTCLQQERCMEFGWADFARDG
jgi:hypothetical protein